MDPRRHGSRPTGFANPLSLPSRPMSRRRRLLIIGAAACALLVVAGAGVAWWIVHEPVGATLPFTPSEQTLPSTDEPAKPEKDRFGPAWPLYGRVDSRTRNATELNAVKP